MDGGKTKETRHPRPDCACLFALPDLDFLLFSFSTIMSSAAFDHTSPPCCTFPNTKNPFSLGSVILIYDQLLVQPSKWSVPLRQGGMRRPPASSAFVLS